MKKIASALAALLFVVASIALAQTPSVPLGTINGVTAGAGLGGGGTLGNVSISSSIAVNRQLGTTYTVLTSDQAKLVTFSNLSSVAITLPTAGSTGFAAGWWAFLSNYGPGTITITPTSGTIGGFASLQVQANVGVQVVSDGANWQITGNQSTAGFVTLGSNNVWTGTNNFTGGFSINGTALTLPVSVANGGTGVVSLTSHGVVIGQGSSAVVTVSPGVAGTVLTSNGVGSDPSFQAGSSSVSSIASGNGLTATPNPITTTGTLALANIGTSTVLGNVSGVSSGPIALTTTQLTTLINIFGSTSSGAVPASGGGTTNFLRADGSFAAPTGGINTVAVQVFTSSGTYTPTASMKYALVFATGSGGGGGAGQNSASGGGGGGGGAGGTSIGVFSAASIGASKAVVIGAAGAAVGAGGNTTFGSTLLQGNGGAAGATGSGSQPGAGGLGGTATTGTLNIIGGDGNPGQIGVAAVTDGSGGNGGGSFWGSGGRGAAELSGLNSAGTAGRAYGSGGGGASGQTNSPGGGSGGIGTLGVVWIIEFI